MTNHVIGLAAMAYCIWIQRAQMHLSWAEVIRNLAELVAAVAATLLVARLAVGLV